MDISKYLNDHTIIKIGGDIHGYVCCEVVVDNPKEFISFILENDCYIAEIRWWDRAIIARGSAIGYGGPKDPNNTDGYYFAETDLVKKFLADTKYEEYIEYLDQINVAYSEFSLYPAFDIKRRRMDGSLS